MKRRIFIVGLAVMMALGGTAVALHVYNGAQAQKVVQAGCSTTLIQPPAFAKDMPYDQNGLPRTMKYAKKVSADAPYAGTYVRAHQVAVLDPKTVTLAPFEKGKTNGARIYVDKSSNCSNIYVAIQHTMRGYNLAVYKKK